MSNVPLYVGVDYHQDQLQLCVIDRDANIRMNRPLPNDAAAVKKLLLDQRGQVKAVAVEACCGAADFAERLAAAGEWRVDLAHPGYVAKLKQSPDKSDYSDGRLLADLTRVGYLPRCGWRRRRCVTCGNWWLIGCGWWSVAGRSSCRSARCSASSG